MTYLLGAIVVVLALMLWRERDRYEALVQSTITMRIAHPYVPAPKVAEREPPRAPDAEIDRERESPLLEPAVAQFMASGLDRKRALAAARDLVRSALG